VNAVSSSVPAASSRIARRHAIAALGLFLVLAGLYIYTSPGRIDIIDGQFRYEVARNWLDRGQPIVVDRALIPIGLSVRTPHGVYAKYNAAASLTAMPLMLLSRALPGHNVERDQFMFAMTAPLFGALLGPLLVIAYSMLGLSLASAVGWALVCCLATLWWPASTTVFDQNQHAVWIMIALILAWESSRRASLWLAGLAGGAGAMLITYQENYALLLPAIGLAVAATVPSEGTDAETRLKRQVDRGTVIRYLIFGLVAGAGLVALLAFNYYRFGGATYEGRYADPLFFGRMNPAAALFGLFLSPGKSIVLFSPPVLLGALGARRFFRGAPGLAIAICVASIIQVAVIAQLLFFGGEWCWGPRYLLVLIPMWALAFPFAVGARRRLVTTLVALGLLVQLAGLSLDHQRFFFERNLAPHFWAKDDWFYLRNSQLWARFGELYSTWRDGVPREAILFSPTPRGEITYSMLGPANFDRAAIWMRRFEVFYRPRPWPLWISAVDPARQPIEPWPWFLLCSTAMIAGTAMLWASVRLSCRKGYGSETAPATDPLRSRPEATVP
jgi:hypothetical protein